MDSLLTREQLAEKLQVHQKTIENYQKRGLPCIYISSKILRYEWTAVVNWLAADAATEAKAVSHRKASRTSATIRNKRTIVDG